jgi:hypothetical protein
MYGPPSDCKGKVVRGRKSALMYPSIRAKMLSRAKISRRCSEATLEAKGFRDHSPSGSLRPIIFGGTFSTNHQFGHDCDHDCLFGHPISIGCEGAYSACRSGFRRPEYISGYPR